MPDDMKGTQEEDLDINKLTRYVNLGKKPTLVQMKKIQSKNVSNYLLKFERLMVRNGVVHWIYDIKGSKYHQLILPL